MKVAIYSGRIPSTIFIENLIKVIASNGEKVFLFGSKEVSVNYKNSNIRQFPTPDQSFIRLVFTASQLIYSFIVYPNRIFKLLRKRNKTIGFKRQINWLSKTLPVINNLPDVFHVQWAKSASEWIFLKELFGVKMVLSLRGAHINYSPVCDPILAETYQNIFPRYDVFHAVSNTIEQKAQIYGAPPDRIQVIYSGVDLEKLNKMRVRTIQTSQLADKQVNIISVGRFHWIKGYTYAIDACRVLKDNGVKFKYTIIATGKSQKYVHQIEDLGLKDYVEIIPGLPHKETLNFIESSDIFLLSSIEEGIANVILEAMALKCLVIATQCGGTKEVIEDEINGIIVEKYNPSSIAHAVKKIVQNYSREKIEQIKNNAYNTIVEKFSNESLGKNFIHFYNKTVDFNRLH